MTPTFTISFNLKNESMVTTECSGLYMSRALFDVICRHPKLERMTITDDKGAVIKRLYQGV